MPRKISAKKRATLIRDLIHADFDLTALRSKYNLTPDSLSNWARDEGNQRCLTGLCVLADIQTQLLLSRYRLIAAGRLIDMATQPPDDSKAGLDTSRRACVDLLKLELPRADIDVSFKASAIDAQPDDGLASLHRLICDAGPCDAEPNSSQYKLPAGNTDD
jgi:hypothetical protein